MPRAVRFDHYGGPEVLQVVDVPRPVPGRGQVLVRVVAAGINPGELSIRAGLLHDRWPATFPSGEGSDLAGVVEELGPEAGEWAVGDEVFGWVETRSSHAELAVAEAGQLARKPEALSWDVAGALFVAGTTAYATVQAVAAGPGDTVVVSGAAGGVGSIAAQLAGLAGSRVIGVASEANHAWLRERGVEPVAYGEGLADRLSAAADGRVDAFIDTFGGGYVALAIELGVAPERVDTIIDWAAAAETGAKAEGSAFAARPEVLAELAGLVVAGRLEVPIAAVYPLEQVGQAYQALAARHARGKIVLRP